MYVCMYVYICWPIHSDKFRTVVAYLNSRGHRQVSGHLARPYRLVTKIRALAFNN